MLIGLGSTVAMVPALITFILLLATLDANAETFVRSMAAQAEPLTQTVVGSARVRNDGGRAPIKAGGVTLSLRRLDMRALQPQAFGDWDASAKN
jgi:hypothetical protein